MNPAKRTALHVHPADEVIVVSRHVGSEPLPVPSSVRVPVGTRSAPARRAGRGCAGTGWAGGQTDPP